MSPLTIYLIAFVVGFIGGLLTRASWVYEAPELAAYRRRARRDATAARAPKPEAAELPTSAPAPVRELFVVPPRPAGWRPSGWKPPATAHPPGRPPRWRGRPDGATDPDPPRAA